jgi:hypothetical protein
MGHAPGGTPRALAPWDLHYYTERESQIDRKHDFVTVMHSWRAKGNYEGLGAEWWDPAMRARYPVLHWTWSPEDWAYDKRAPENYALRPAAIANGDHDSYIDTFAEGLKALGGRVILRFAHEQNGDFMQWSPEFFSGQTAEDYVAMWRHVRSRFDALEVANVEWCWCPQGIGEGGEYESQLAPTYPGDYHVDWVGIDQYNIDPTAPEYYSFRQLFERTYNLITQIVPTKKMCVPEFGAVENTRLGPDVKRQFWVDMRQDLPVHFPEIKWLSVWDRNLEGNFCVDSSAASKQTYTEMVNDPYFTASLQNIPAKKRPPMRKSG